MPRYARARRAPGGRLGLLTGVVAMMVLAMGVVGPATAAAGLWLCADPAVASTSEPQATALVRAGARPINDLQPPAVLAVAGPAGAPARLSYYRGRLSGIACDGAGAALEQLDKQWQVWRTEGPVTLVLALSGAGACGDLAAAGLGDAVDRLCVERDGPAPDLGTAVTDALLGRADRNGDGRVDGAEFLAQAAAQALAEPGTAVWLGAGATAAAAILSQPGDAAPPVAAAGKLGGPLAALARAGTDAMREVAGRAGGGLITGPQGLALTVVPNAGADPAVLAVALVREGAQVTTTTTDRIYVEAPAAALLPMAAQPGVWSIEPTRRDFQPMQDETQP